MKSIPKKYLKAENLGEALLNIRRFLASGLTVEQMAQQINMQYAKASAEDKVALGKLLAAVYDFENPETAKKCAQLFGLFPSSGPIPQRTVSYQIVRDYLNKFGSNHQYWLDEFDRDPMRRFEVKNVFDKERYWMVAPAKEAGDVIHMADNVYMIIEPSITVNFLTIEDCYLDMLIDEDFFDDGSGPLYFTECTHFISPVYKVKTAKRIFEYFLERIGFPKVNIKLNVLFTSTKGILINKKEFMEGGQFAKDWEGVEIFELRSMDKRKDFMFHPCCLEDSCKKDKKDNHIGELSLKEGLLQCLNATAELYEVLHLKDQLVKNDRPHLTTLARKLGLFKPKK